MVGPNIIVNEVTAEKWVYGGDSLARVEGQVVLTPYLLPGETARVEAVQEKPGLVRAVARDIVAPSPHRVEPPCPYFYRCGGCHYQHAEYSFQVEQKAAILREQLRRVGRIQYDGAIGTVSGEPFGYRNRTQFHIDGGRIGYYGEGSHELVEIDHCPISSPKINEVLGELVQMAGDSRWPKFLRVLEVFTNETDVVLNVVESGQPVSRRFFEWCEDRMPGSSGGSLEYAAAGQTFRISHNSFFQVNRFLVDALVESAVGHASGGTAYDLYAGAGLFSVALARGFERVVAVESGTSAVRDLQFNAERAGMAVEVEQANVEAFLPGLHKAPDLVVADPPRAGLGKSVTRELARLQAARVVIVSCDPATLARDLAVLLSAGYTIEGITMLDLFPQTYHLEAVVRLRLQ